jgi:hypothetical protein
LGGGRVTAARIETVYVDRYGAWTNETVKVLV